MAYSMLGSRGLVMFAICCFGGCDAVGNDASADPSMQGLAGSESDGGIGYLLPTPIADGGSLTTKPAPKNDAGVAQGDAGQTQTGTDAGTAEVDAGTDDTQGDAGQDSGRVRILEIHDDGLPDCNAVYFRDLDGDGFGDGAAKVTSCTKPAGYVEIDGDCYDANERAFPGATGQFLQHRGDGNFDYDCDGKETKLHTELATCPSVSCTALDCDPDALDAADDAAHNGGWTSLPNQPGVIPGCGQVGAWGLQVVWHPGLNAAACIAPSEAATRIQTCR